MSDTQHFALTITQERDFAFRVDFDDTTLAALHTDEPAPLGGDGGPDPARLLVAAVANCLAASLLFALRKFRNDADAIVARARGTLERNAAGRWRVGRIEVAIELPGAATDYPRLERPLALFEDFCVVTESVREGVAVDVTVRDASGAVLHETHGA